VDPRAGLDVVAKKKKFVPCRQSNHGYAARSIVIILDEGKGFSHFGTANSVTELPLLLLCYCILGP
jgi:hypothetical protein